VTNEANRMADEAKLTLTLHLHDVLTTPGGKAPIKVGGSRDAAGGEALEDLTLGVALANLLLGMSPSKGDPKKVLRCGRVQDKLAKAIDSESGEYVVGEIALGVLRAAAGENGPGYKDFLMAQVLLKIGTGEDESAEDI